MRSCGCKPINSQFSSSLLDLLSCRINKLISFSDFQLSKVLFSIVGSAILLIAVTFSTLKTLQSKDNLSLSTFVVCFVCLVAAALTMLSACVRFVNLFHPYSNPECYRRIFSEDELDSDWDSGVDHVNTSSPPQLLSVVETKDTQTAVSCTIPIDEQRKGNTSSSITPESSSISFEPHFRSMLQRKQMKSEPKGDGDSNKSTASQSSDIVTLPLGDSTDLESSSS